MTELIVSQFSASVARGCSQAADEVMTKMTVMFEAVVRALNLAGQDRCSFEHFVFMSAGPDSSQMRFASGCSGQLALTASLAGQFLVAAHDTQLSGACRRVEQRLRHTGASDGPSAAAHVPSEAPSVSRPGPPVTAPHGTVLSVNKNAVANAAMSALVGMNLQAHLRRGMWRQILVQLLTFVGKTKPSEVLWTYPFPVVEGTVRLPLGFPEAVSFTQAGKVDTSKSGSWRNYCDAAMFVFKCLGANAAAGWACVRGLCDYGLQLEEADRIAEQAVARELPTPPTADQTPRARNDSQQPSQAAAVRGTHGESLHAAASASSGSAAGAAPLAASLSGASAATSAARSGAPAAGTTPASGARAGRTAAAAAGASAPGTGPAAARLAAAAVGMSGARAAGSHAPSATEAAALSAARSAAAAAAAAAATTAAGGVVVGVSGAAAGSYAARPGEGLPPAHLPASAVPVLTRGPTLPLTAPPGSAAAGTAPAEGPAAGAPKARSEKRRRSPAASGSRRVRADVAGGMPQLCEIDTALQRLAPSGVHPPHVQAKHLTNADVGKAELWAAVTPGQALHPIVMTAFVKEAMKRTSARAYVVDWAIACRELLCTLVPATKCDTIIFPALNESWMCIEVGQGVVRVYDPLGRGQLNYADSGTLERIRRVVSHYRQRHGVLPGEGVVSAAAREPGMRAPSFSLGRAGESPVEFVTGQVVEVPNDSGVQVCAFIAERLGLGWTNNSRFELAGLVLSDWIP